MAKAKKNETTPNVAAGIPLKFALYDFKGEPVSYYLIDEVTPPQPTLTKTPGHHVCVIDRSGSMFSAMAETRSVVEKIATLQEFADADMLMSVISYSSSGDVTVHVARTPVKDIMKPGSKYVEQIRQMQATCMTCVSQAVTEAERLIGTETTAITIHTDGYFNDPSPASEQRSLETKMTQLAKRKNVIVNAVAYGYADFPMLSKIANMASGKCVKAGSIKEVFDALHDTSALLAGNTTPAMVSEKGDADYQVAFNVTQKKINGTTADLEVRGNKAEDNFKLYRFRLVTKAAFDKTTGSPADCSVMYAFARAKLAEGKLNDAKYAISATGNQVLLKDHAKALTNTQLTAFALAIEEEMFNGKTPVMGKPGLENTNGPTLLALFNLLNEHKADFTVDLTILAKGYKRQGVKKIRGVWSHEKLDAPTEKDIAVSVFEPCPFRLVPSDDPTMVSTGGFAVNNAEATINLRVDRPAVLEKSGTAIKTIAGIKLDLGTFNNYTIVSNGDVNVEALPLRVSKKTLFAELVKIGALPDGTFNPKAVYSLPLKDFPAVSFDQTFGDIPADLVQRMAIRRSMLGLCEVILKLRDTSGETPTAWTAEQEKELKEHFLSPKMYFSAPTRNPYKDKNQAIAHGLIDSRTRYTIDIGDKDLLSLRDLPSANAFFTRRFVGGKKGEKAGKVSIPDLFNSNITIEAKPTGRLTLGSADDLLFGFYESFAGTGKIDIGVKMLGQVGIPAGVAKTFLAEKKVDELQQTALTIKNLLDIAQEKDYATYVRPLAFYMGASGLIPDGWDVKVMNAEGLTAKWPKLKGDADATYIVSGELIITLAAESVDILTEAGLAAVKSLSSDEPDDD